MHRGGIRVIKLVFFFLLLVYYRMCGGCLSQEPITVEVKLVFLPYSRHIVARGKR